MTYNDFVGGWLVGDFAPSLIRRDGVEVGLKYLTKGFVDAAHFHKNSTEFNLIVYGKVQTGSKVYSKGDFMNFGPGEVSQVECLEDAAILVIRDGSGVGDKYEV